MSQIKSSFVITGLAYAHISALLIQNQKQYN